MKIVIDITKFVCYSSILCFRTCKLQSTVIIAKEMRLSVIILAFFFIGMKMKPFCEVYYDLSKFFRTYHVILSPKLNY